MSEYHVCGLLLMARPEQVPSVTQAIAAMPNVEVHAHDGGRLVVTVEGNAYQECAEHMNRLAVLGGVASSSLVYHRVDNEHTAEEPRS